MIRFLLGSEFKGTIVVVYCGLRKVDIGCISESNYSNLKELQSDRCNVYKIIKNPSGTPAGLSDIFEHMKQNCKTVGMFPQEYAEQKNAKLMLQVFELIQSNGL